MTKSQQVLKELLIALHDFEAKLDSVAMPMELAEEITEAALSLREFIDKNEKYLKRIAPECF